jgi:hypothetical protein
MNTKTTLTLAAALLVPSLKAQQNPQPQPQAPQMKEAPCPPSLPKPPKGIRFHLPKTMQDEINKKFAGITKTTGVELTPPSPAELAKQAQKPCPLPTTAPVTAPAPAAVTPTNDNKTMLVCPPNTTKLEGYSYCMKPDHTLVDAIQIPAPSLSNPAPIRAAAPGPAQK